MSSLLVQVFFPLIGAFFALIYSRLNRISAFIMSLVPFLFLLFGKNDNVTLSWIPALSVNFSLKIDPVSTLFLYLTAVIIPYVIYTAKENSSSFYAWIFLLQAAVIGFFLANDLILFTLFWEAMLLPLFFIILLYGIQDQVKAALKFLVYMLAGSCFLLAGVLSIYLSSDSFDLSALHLQANSYPGWIFFIFILAFAVKTPLFPFHAWLPDVYYSASTSGTILLSALLSKAGIYGIYRIGYGLFPDMMKTYSVPLLCFAIGGVLYGALAAYRSFDFKRLIAYSSFSHVNFILAGLFIGTSAAFTGVWLQVFNHGITIAALFLLIGYLSSRISSTSLNAASGLNALIPKLGWVLLFFTLSSMALPGTSNFVGEILILVSVFESHAPLASLLALSLILGAVYMLRFFHSLFFGPLKSAQNSFKDLTLFEAAPLILFIFLTLLIGLHPQFLLVLSYD